MTTMNNNKDWRGDTHSVMVSLGASCHAQNERAARDYYATEPKAAKLLLEVEKFDHHIWECACGEKHLAAVFEEAGHSVRCSDIGNRCENEVMDFLQCNEPWHGDIITNPPYKYATEFVKKALSLVGEGSKIAMFLRIQFLEGKRRKRLFEKNPPHCVYVSSSRLKCAINGDFENIAGSAACYARFVWQKGFSGDTIIKWIN